MTDQRDVLHSGLPAFPRFDHRRMHGYSAGIFLNSSVGPRSGALFTSTTQGFAKVLHLLIGPDRCTRSLFQGTLPLIASGYHPTQSLP